MKVFVYNINIDYHSLKQNILISMYVMPIKFKVLRIVGNKFDPQCMITNIMYVYTYSCLSAGTFDMWKSVYRRHNIIFNAFNCLVFLHLTA